MQHSGRRQLILLLLQIGDVLFILLSDFLRVVLDYRHLGLIRGYKQIALSQLLKQLVTNFCGLKHRAFFRFCDGLADQLEQLIRTRRHRVDYFYHHLLDGRLRHLQRLHLLLN